MYHGKGEAGGENVDAAAAPILQPFLDIFDTRPRIPMQEDPAEMKNDAPTSPNILGSHSSTVYQLPQSVRGLASCAQYILQEVLPYQHNNDTALDDGFMICDLNTVRRKLLAWYRIFPNVKPFFAMKCHPDPRVMDVLSCGIRESKTGSSSSVLSTKLTCGFDCASLQEIELALKLVSPQHIIYAHPQRPYVDLIGALRRGVRCFTFDTSHELTKIYQACIELGMIPNQTLLLILRLLVPDETSAVPLGEKFGSDLDQIPAIVETARELELEIGGLSFHCGSGNHDPGAYTKALELANMAKTIVESKQKSRCYILDIGGGYPGYDGVGGDINRFSASDVEYTTAQLDAEPSTKHVADAIIPVLEANFAGMNVIAEPGRYFVEGAFALCSQIFRAEGNEQHREYYISHGVQGIFKDCLLCGESFEPLPLVGLDPGNRKIPSTVHGVSGEPCDIVCPEVDLPYLCEGDWLLFDRMGAYTLSLAPSHLKPPMIYVERSKEMGTV